VRGEGVQGEAQGVGGVHFETLFLSAKDAKAREEKQIQKKQVVTWIPRIIRKHAAAR
jgi:hypothetical protein